MNPLSLVLRDRTLRLVALALLLMGAHNASIYPYQSLIAIERIGLTKPAFALVLVLASGVAVTSSVLFGIFTDQKAGRRRIALITALASTIGIALMLVVPGPVALILAHGILLPVSSSLYGQLFALANLARGDAGRTRDGLLATMRAGLSLSFLAMLIFWTFVFATGIDVMAIYLSAGVASLALSILVYIRWPRDGSTPWQDRPSGLNMAGALAEIAHPRVLLRLLLLGAVASAGVLYMVLISLIFEASPHRTTSDVALYVGMVAGWEVPFMLILTQVGVRLRRSTLISVGSVVYCGHLALLPVLVGTPLVWFLPLLAGIGGTAIITLPIAYYQDLMHGRPGTAGAMLALQKLVADVLAAAAFVVGTHFGGYGLTALLGACISIGGALGLAIADRNA